MMKCCNCTTTSTSKIMHSWWILKMAYGLLFVAAGADKFFNLITPWSKYISPVVLQYLTPYVAIEAATLLMGVAIFEILVGLMILTCATRLGAHLAALWLLIVAANLITMGYPYDIAVRDIILAVGACVLGCLSASRRDVIVVDQQYR